MSRRAAAVTAAQLAVVAAWSQPGAPADPSLASPGPYLLQALLSLLVVIGLIYAAHFVARRLTGGGFAARQGGPARLVQTLPLGAGQNLHVVDLAKQRWLVVTGAGGTQMTRAGDAEAEGDDHVTR